MRLSSSFVSSAFSSRGLFCSKCVQRRFLRFDGVRGRNSRRRRFRPRRCPRRRRRSLSSSSLLLLLSLRVPLLLVLLLVSSSRAFVYLALIYRPTLIGLLSTKHPFDPEHTHGLLSSDAEKEKTKSASRDDDDDDDDAETKNNTALLLFLLFIYAAVLEMMFPKKERKISVRRKK